MLKLKEEEKVSPNKFRAIFLACKEIFLSLCRDGEKSVTSYSDV